MNENITKNLNNLTRILGADRLMSVEDVQSILKGIVEILATYKKGTESINEDTKKVVNKLLEDVVSIHKESLNAVEEKKSELAEGFADKLTELKKMIIDFKEGISKEHALLMAETEDDTDDEAEKQTLIEEIMAQITLPEVKATIVSGEEIVDKINELPLSDDNKIDYARLKNVPVIKGKVISGSPTVLANAVDLDGSTRANNYSVVWDATRGRYTHAASAGSGTVTQVGTTGLISGGPITATGTITTSMATNKLVGRSTAGTGIMEEITVGSGLSLSAGTLTATGSGTGDVVGPASSTDNAVARFDSTTGKLIQNSTATLSDAGVLTTSSVVTPEIKASSSAGVDVHNSSGTQVALFGAGGSTGSTLAGTTNIGSASADYIQIAGNTGSTTQTATGSSTDIDITLIPKGAGKFKVTGNANISGLTASQITATNASKDLVSLDTATYPSLTELTYVKGVTSAIQTQLNAKQSTITFGTGVQTALGVNVGTAGAPVINGGALGTPSSGTVTNLTGTASININGTVGATTPTTATFTTATINTGLLPDANDGAYLGQAGTAFSDLFLAEGAVINWDSGDATLTQTGNVLAVAGADFQIATAGVGTNADSVPTLSSTNTFTNKFITPQVQSVTDAGGTLTPVSITNDIVIATALSQATTIAAPTGSPVQGERLVIRLKDNGTARALTWNSIYRAVGVTLPTTTVISKTVYCGFFYNSTDTKWDCVAVAQEA